MEVLYCNISTWKTWRLLIHVNATADEEDGKTDNSAVKMNLDVKVPMLSCNAFPLTSLNCKGRF